MEIHRILFKLFQRNGISIEREVEEYATEFQVQQPQKLTKAIRQSDNLVSIPIPSGITFKYVLILAKYLTDDTAIGVKKDDPAPLICRINGSSLDHPTSQGFVAWAGGINTLRVATTYDTNQILIEIYLG
ncbi:hypothetical protein [Leptospira santarosai]|uniref:Uncharacterized protein n=1 Tax=Leptospira santarosai str. ZUN179 TaxID=1049985 RepID=M6VCD6_9LEPT|nr:hypothetical protein [Leptospira santarosai]EKS06893.1 hypothetical protein LEP1GSC071_1697 [Leptospira santarosai str. JET]EMF91182.1 hypothetical protein LEP1GSC005_1326 [Leptospira santarosai str. ST188]EMO14659.1 hypothetical protein LEP1GSC165_0378 [Leptospira santarosai str. CBC523]EMO21487.1 hypothetical protein LEP1GSC168_4196 [Leptospira santarosai str. HAI134]EMO31624.1 hypothetical protein LEP1GSC175_0972 [Leptospira santarosai str. HAI821]